MNRYNGIKDGVLEALFENNYWRILGIKKPMVLVAILSVLFETACADFTLPHQ